MSLIKHCLPLLILGLLGADAGQAHAQGRFDVEALFFTRDNDTSAPLIVGPGALDSGAADFSYEAGYRFTLGGDLGLFDVEISGARIGDWSWTDHEILADELLFDDPVDNFFPPGNSLGFFNGIFQAATFPGPPAGADETTESELLEAGAALSTRYTSRLDDFELNIGSSPERHWWRVAVGFRHLSLDDNLVLSATGIFQTVDILGGALPGGVGDGPNNALSHAALIAAGFANVGGPTDGFVGYNPTILVPTPTTLNVRINSQAQNRLEGVQALLGGRVSPFESFSIEGFLKAGVFQNRANAIVTETLTGLVNDASVYNRRVGDSDTDTSFAGGGGVRVLLPIVAQLRFVAGYEALVITNVALGPDQTQGIGIDALGAPTLDLVMDGELVTHGANLGFEVVW